MKAAIIEVGSTSPSHLNSVTRNWYRRDMVVAHAAHGYEKNAKAQLLHSFNKPPLIPKSFTIRESLMGCISSNPPDHLCKRWKP